MMASAAEEICHSSPRSENNATTVQFKITRKNQDRPWKLRVVYLQCYFISVATILGTGILGLPVTVARAGLLPFLVSFLIGFFIQGLLIYLFVDLLQRCRASQMESLKSAETERIQMQDVCSEEPSVTQTEGAEEEEEEEESEEPGLLGSDLIRRSLKRWISSSQRMFSCYPRGYVCTIVTPFQDFIHHDRGLLQRGVADKTLEKEPEPNLHVLGLLFLSKRMSHAFNFILLFQFISIGISYALAGSEAYAELLQVSHTCAIPVFTWILSLGILLAQVVIQPITSLLTLLKGAMLIVTVSVTFAVGSEVHQQMTNDFSQIGKPFLMGTVALGGIVNVMPFLFSEISNNRTQILWFRRAVLAGLVTCAILNVLWCWAVLEIVPQMSVQKVLEDGVWNKSASLPAYTLTYSNISLEQSERAGEIATIPLTQIITQKYSRFSWVAQLIQTFIAISLTVSFLVMGSAMKHTIDGLVTAHWDLEPEGVSGSWEKSLPHFLQGCNTQRLARGFMSVLAFGLIFLVAVCDPKAGLCSDARQSGVFLLKHGSRPVHLHNAPDVQV
ncbi:uncharacterized protein si:ch211-51h4.2 isoform X1 [Anguilla rostrata]|uniref:uncharacterized protein si:ch211-51h4.2 isoform X1 n=1 Tax=Anguilla rostrata TaxID=7938 RepID=UPI0030CD10AB